MRIENCRLNTLRRNFDGVEYNFIDPNVCNFPAGTVVEASMIPDGEEYAIAWVRYRGNAHRSLAIRWVITDSFKEQNEDNPNRNEEVCVGLPCIGATPLWFILPDDIADRIQFFMSEHPKKDMSSAD